MQIIELHDHSEVVYSIGKLLEHLGVDYSIVAKSHVLDDCRVLKCKKIELNRADISALNEFCLFTTVLPHDFEMIRKLKGKKNIGIIHNIHSIFYPQENKLPITSWSRLKYEIQQISKNNTSVKPILELLDFITCPAPWMISLGKKKYNSKWIDSVPFSYCESVGHQNENQVIIGVPGTVNAHARDYSLLLNALKKISTQLKNKVSLHFLGSASSTRAKRIQKQFNRLASNRLKIIFNNNGYVHQEEYLKKLSNVDFLVIPTKKNYSLGKIRETYGVSNLTGSESDMIRYAIPALWIDHYPLSTPLESISNRFSDDQTLADRLIKWINEKEFLSYESTRQVVCDHFSLQNQASKLKQSLSQAGVVFP